jgi:hypothetical protein
MGAARRRRGPRDALLDKFEFAYANSISRRKIVRGETGGFIIKFPFGQDNKNQEGSYVMAFQCNTGSTKKDALAGS